MGRPTADQAAHLNGITQWAFVPSPGHTELQTFDHFFPSMIGLHAGKYVLIKGTEVIDVYDTYDDAIKVGYDRFKLEPFLVRELVQVTLPFDNPSPAPAPPTHGAKWQQAINGGLGHEWLVHPSGRIVAEVRSEKPGGGAPYLAADGRYVSLETAKKAAEAAWIESSQHQDPTC